MKKQNLLRTSINTVGTALLAAGMFFAFLPHAFHSRAGFIEHEKHTAYGIVVVVAALVMLAINNKALKTSLKLKSPRP